MRICSVDEIGVFGGSVARPLWNSIKDTNKELYLVDNYHFLPKNAREPFFKFVKTKGLSTLIFFASRFITSSEAPTCIDKSVLFITSKSDFVIPGPPLRGILSPAATSMT